MEKRISMHLHKPSHDTSVTGSFQDAHALLVLLLVLHGESSKRLAPPRNTKHRKHLQSTQTTVNRHNSQTKHQALSKGSQDA